MKWYGHAAESIALGAVRRLLRALARPAGRPDQAPYPGLDLLDLHDLFPRASPDLLLREVAEAQRPLVVEVEQVARLLEADRARVGEQVVGGLGARPVGAQITAIGCRSRRMRRIAGEASP